MGYELHITRAEFWCENDEYRITPQEWLDVVASDPELTIDSENGPYHAIWSGPSEHEMPWLDWNDGNISTKNPDKPLIGKMIQLAKRFNATVQGDDCELYDVSGVKRR